MRKRTELLACLLALTVALCSCGDERKSETIPEIAGPCPPGPPITVRAAHRLNDGSIVLVLERRGAIQ